MSKFLAWLFFFVYIFGLTTQIRADTNVLSPEILQMLEEMLRSSGFVNPQSIPEIKMAASNFADCTSKAIEKHVSTGATPLRDIKKFCDALQNNRDMYVCIDQAAKKFSPCLPPDFAISVYDGVVKEFCSGKNEQMIKDLQEALECMAVNSGTLRIKIMMRCLPIASFMRALQERFNTGIAGVTENICGDLEMIKNCTVDVINETCNKDYGKVINEILQPFVSLCRIQKGGSTPTKLLN